MNHTHGQKAGKEGEMKTATDKANERILAAGGVPKVLRVEIVTTQIDGPDPGVKVDKFMRIHSVTQFGSDAIRIMAENPREGTTADVVVPIVGGLTAKGVAIVQLKAIWNPKGKAYSPTDPAYGTPPARYGIEFIIRRPDDPAAGIRGFTDEVTVTVASGDPGDTVDEFKDHIRASLQEWYDDGVSVTDGPSVANDATEPPDFERDQEAKAIKADGRHFSDRYPGRSWG